MDLLIGLIILIVAFLVIKALAISMWTLLIVLAIIALVVYIARNSRTPRL